MPLRRVSANNDGKALTVKDLDYMHRSKRGQGKKTENHQNKKKNKAMRKCQTNETNMEQQRGNHGENWKTPTTEEDADGTNDDDDDDDDDDDGNDDDDDDNSNN